MHYNKYGTLEATEAEHELLDQQLTLQKQLADSKALLSRLLPVLKSMSEYVDVNSLILEISKQL